MPLNRFLILSHIDYSLVLKISKKELCALTAMCPNVVIFYLPYGRSKFHRVSACFFFAISVTGRCGNISFAREEISIKNITTRGDMRCPRVAGSQYKVDGARADCLSALEGIPIIQYRH